MLSTLLARCAVSEADTNCSAAFLKSIVPLLTSSLRLYRLRDEMYFVMSLVTNLLLPRVDCMTSYSRRAVSSSSDIIRFTLIPVASDRLTLTAARLMPSYVMSSITPDAPRPSILPKLRLSIWEEIYLDSF